MPEVKIYTSSFCGYCAAAKRLLNRKGIEFTEVDVTNNDEARVAMVESSGGRRTVPQVFIGGAAIGGYTELAALDRGGRLAKLLEGDRGSE